MTEKEIMQALECCIKPTSDCDNCPYYSAGDGDCVNKVKENALDLINRQQAEIDYWKQQAFNDCMEKGNIYKVARTEAIKDFVDALKCAINPFADYEGEDVWKIVVEVAEEMVGASDDI